MDWKRIRIQDQLHAPLTLLKEQQKGGTSRGSTSLIFHLNQIKLLGDVLVTLLDKIELHDHH